MKVLKSENFKFASDAKSFQRKKRKDGYKTKIEHHLGIASPYRIVTYWKEETNTLITN